MCNSNPERRDLEVQQLTAIVFIVAAFEVHDRGRRCRRRRRHYRHHRLVRRLRLPRSQFCGLCRDLGLCVLRLASRSGWFFRSLWYLVCVSD